MKRRKRRNQKLLALVILLVIASLVAFWALYPRNPGKTPAEKYFSISKDSLEPLGFTHENGTVLELLTLGFKITAVEGDANVVAISAGVYNRELIEIIKHGETKYVNLLFSPHYYSTKLEPEGFVVEINIWSVEAKGNIKLHIPPDMMPPSRD